MCPQEQDVSCKDGKRKQVTHEEERNGDGTRVSSDSDCVSDPDFAKAMLTDVTEKMKIKSGQKQELLSCAGNPESETVETTSDFSWNLQPTPEEMFYLPKWNFCPKLHPLKPNSTTLTLILYNVKHFLFSPIPEMDGTNCSFNNDSLLLDEPKEIRGSRKTADQFQVNFSLEGDQNSLDGDSNVAVALSEPADAPQAPPELALLPGNAFSPGLGPKSPSWEMLFDHDLDHRAAERKADLPLGSKKRTVFKSLDESVDLFGDDEVFLQVSLPEIKTPDKETPKYNPIMQQTGRTLHASHQFNTPVSSKALKTPHKVPLGQNVSPVCSEAGDYSEDLFSVNFDLGFYLDSDKEETAEQNPDMAIKRAAEQEQTSLSLKPSRPTSNFSLGQTSTPRIDQKATFLMAKTNWSPIIPERKILGLKSSSSPSTPGFASAKSTRLETSSKAGSPQTECGADSRLFPQSLPRTRKPVHEGTGCSGNIRSIVLK